MSCKYIGMFWMKVLVCEVMLIFRPSGQRQSWGTHLEINIFLLVTSSIAKTFQVNLKISSKSALLMAGS